MDQMKLPVFVFADQGQVVHHQRRGQQRAKLRFKGGDHRGQLGFRQFPGQGDVKAEIIHHVWIAPLHKVGLLRLAQCGRASLSQFSLACRGTKPVKFADTAGGQCAERRVLRGAQCQKPAQPCQGQPLQAHRGQTGAQTLHRDFKIAQTRAFSQPEWRFDRPVQPVFARRPGDLIHRRGQPGNIGVRNGASGFHIPPQPGGRPAGPIRPGRWRIIDCKAFERHAGSGRLMQFQKV